MRTRLPGTREAIPEGFWDTYRSPKDRPWRHRDPHGPGFVLMRLLEPGRLDQFTDEEIPKPKPRRLPRPDDLGAEGRALADLYSQPFDDTPRGSPRGGRRPRLSDRECVAYYLGAVLRELGWRRLAEAEGTRIGPTHWAYRRGKRLVDEAVAAGLYEGMG